MRVDVKAAEAAYSAVYGADPYRWDADKDTDPLARIVTAPSDADAVLALTRVCSECGWGSYGDDDAVRLRGAYLRLVPPYGADGMARVDVEAGATLWVLSADASSRGLVAISKRTVTEHGDSCDSYRGLIGKDGALITSERTGVVPLAVLRAAYELWERTGGSHG